ncbi:MAG: exodeoxyribonuclease V subunit gamma [Verrucomicrobiota bacterium]
MPLTLHASNRLEELARELAEILGEPLASPFTPEIVVVPGNGVRHWLTQQLAVAHGVCANVQFPFPHNFFVDLLREVFPQMKRSQVFETEPMAWRIWQALPKLAREPAFTPVRRYLEGERADLRGYELSRRVAHIFSQYLVFRPEKIMAWDAGEGKDWQATLWREVQRVAPGEHAAALSEKLKQALRTNARAPERVAIFGLATLPPSSLSLLQTLALGSAVHLFVLEPTPEWTGDVRTRREQTRSRQLDLFDESEPAFPEITNPLLTENTRVSRDFLNLLWEIDGLDDRRHFVRPENDTMLHCVQRDLFELRDGAPIKNGKVEADDASVQIHSCHSVTRELEVLRDQLLNLFEKDRALKPGEIVVLVPKMADYAPFIDAVFGVAENAAQRIPYTIADRRARARSGAVDTFLRILELMPSRFGATDVFAVLESPALQRRFQLRDLPRLQRWTEKSGIRWGIDSGHRARFGLPALAHNSWRAGLERMLLGYAMPPEARDLVGGILPFDEIEGEGAELLGNFVDCLETMFARAADFAIARSLQAWSSDLRSAVDQFLDPDELGQIELTQLRNALEKLSEVAVVSENDEPVSLEIAKLQLENLLPESTSGFLAGAVTFSALKPLVPAKVICLLGLNDTAFPRRQETLEFDLILQQPRRGDRNRRDDDRALFLEALLSSRDVLYVSFVGQSLRDNKALPPSVVVSELIDYLARRFERDAKTIPIENSLQAFSARNFGRGDDPRRFSFSEENAAAGQIAAAARAEAAPFVGQPLPDLPEEWREVALTDLVNFFECPSRFFLQRRLKLDLPRDRDALEDREPFDLHPLDRWRVGQELLDDVLSGRDPGESFSRARAQGVLPAGGAGELLFDEVCEEARAFAETIRLRLDEPLTPPRDFRTEIGKFVIHGRFDSLRGEMLVRYRLAKFKAKDFVRIWLEHLLLNLEKPSVALLFGKAKNDVQGYRFEPVADARARLENLLGYFEQGMRAPLPLFPRSSWALAESLRHPPARRSSKQPGLAEWHGSEGEDSRGEKHEAHIELAFRNVLQPLDDTWKKCAKEIYLPILRARQPL